MSKPLKLGKDGRLAVSEADVERAIQDFLEAEGWAYIHTKAEHLKRNGAPSHKSGTLDAVAIRYASDLLSEVIFIEHKRRNARTKAAHLKEQAETAAELRRRGFDVYRAPEAHKGDMVQHFKDWYGVRFDG